MNQVPRNPVPNTKSSLGIAHMFGIGILVVGLALLITGLVMRTSKDPKKKDTGLTLAISGGAILTIVLVMSACTLSPGLCTSLAVLGAFSN